MESINISIDYITTKFIDVVSNKELPILSNIKVFRIGAEALILRATFLNHDVVVKWRFPKPYMPQALDKQFRIKRTITEAKVLIKALELGVDVPTPLFIDPEEGILILEFVEGPILRDIVDSLSDADLCCIMKRVGMAVAKLHNADIVHGDLTTANVILRHGRLEPVLIDFGLADFSKRLEDKAIDIHIMFRAIESTHYDREEIMKKCFVEGYGNVSSKLLPELLRIVDDIRRRGRYVSERRLRTEWRSV